jgi:hypothetical protein
MIQIILVQINIIIIYMPCNCNYNVLSQTGCVSCLNIENTTAKQSLVQKRIWNQVRAPASTYLMNLSSFTSASQRLASKTNVNWNQMSDSVSAAKQPALNPTHGNSLKRTLTSDRPGAGTPGGAGVDVKHDSYARYLNRKKAVNMKTQTQNIATRPLHGNKTNAINILSNSANCCT